MSNYRLPKTIENIVLQIVEREIRARDIAHRALLRLSEADFAVAQDMLDRWTSKGVSSSSLFANAMERATIDRNERSKK